MAKSLSGHIHGALNSLSHFHTILWIGEHGGRLGMMATIIEIVQKATGSQIEWAMIAVLFGASLLALIVTRRANRNAKESQDSASPKIHETPSITEPKLTIHSAVYGGDRPHDIDTDVAPKLRSLTRDGLVVTVDNGLVPEDLAKMHRKRLKVVYSYGNDRRIEIERPESTPTEIIRMVLPEDTWLTEELKKAEAELRRVKAIATGCQEQLAFIEKTRDDLTTQANASLKLSREQKAELDALKIELASAKEELSGIPPSLPLARRAVLLGREIFSFLKEKGPRPEHPVDYMGRFRRENPRYMAIPDKESGVVSDAWFRYEEGVRPGYLLRFHEKVL